jgi:hypothetical protein
MDTKRMVLVFLMACAFTATATNDSGRAAFFDSMEITYRQQFKECTGNAGYLGKKGLLEWKDAMDSIKASPSYKEILREYRASVDSSKDPLPCRVIAWNRERKAAQHEKEKALATELLAREEKEAFFKEVNDLPKSAYDFPKIPFGLAKKSFCALFRQVYNLGPVDMEDYVYVNDFNFGKRKFLVAFHFDKGSGLFYKYEIEGPALAAEFLNRFVRPDAEDLASMLAQSFGESSRRHSIGFFDIKSGVLSPYKTWDVPGYDIIVGISMDDYKYYAKAVVARNKDFAKKQNAPANAAKR